MQTMKEFLESRGAVSYEINGKSYTMDDPSPDEFIYPAPAVEIVENKEYGYTKQHYVSPYNGKPLSAGFMEVPVLE